MPAASARPRQAPLEIAPESYSIRAVTPSVGSTWTNLNSLVIRAAEPVVIDTGMVTDREQWFDDVFSLVAPEEVRWLWVTHLDTDHAGNMIEALARCPNARLVTSRGESYRVASSYGIGFERMALVDNGQTLDVGDRELLALRPPVYDSPYTRGVLDTKTRAYYASDAFCAPMPGTPVDWAGEIEDREWAAGMAQFHHHTLCPWIGMVDPSRFAAEVQRYAELDLSVIASAHAPTIEGRSVRRALDLMAGLPRTNPADIAFADEPLPAA